MGIDGILSQGNPSSFDSIESLNDFHQYDCYRRSTSSSLPELLHTTIITVQLSLETLINTFWCRILWHTLLPSWLSSTIR
mmetsp:Transcript_24087/g.36601  ORF Transcript_24087/g.36601 Transcript_24087/m.36601 type:complete len:80 (-) Transcript_24087:342-581(-)